MPTLALKSYQQAALDTLTAFAQAAQVGGAARAFEALAGRPYQSEPFGPDVPCVCLRIPTGGGTLEAEYQIPPDAWYFSENGNRTMPYAVLLEAGMPFGGGTLCSHLRGHAIGVDFGADRAFHQLATGRHQRVGLAIVFQPFGQ